MFLRAIIAVNDDWTRSGGAYRLNVTKNKGAGEVMNELAENDVCGIVVRDEYEREQWRVYFQGRLTAPRFSSRCAALGYLAALRSGARKPEFALAHEGKEVRR